jgi:hypothetical protein
MKALPADGIRQLVSQTDANLIVMDTHGRSGVNRWMLGSVTERAGASACGPTNVTAFYSKQSIGTPIDKSYHRLCSNYDGAGIIRDKVQGNE